MSIHHNDTPTSGTINNITILVSHILITAVSTSTEPLEHDSITSYEQKSPPYVILLDNDDTVEISYADIIKDS